LTPAGSAGEISRQAARMWKAVVGLFAFALLLSAGWMGHALATGIVVPYHDPTPERAAYERYHLAISMPLSLAAAAGWQVTGVVSAVALGRWVFRSGFRRTDL
jgi:hypothetical protein